VLGREMQRLLRAIFGHAEITDADRILRQPTE
jgi:hypothetical protein